VKRQTADEFEPDDEDDEGVDPEAPDASDMDRDGVDGAAEDNVDTVACPYCGRAVYEHADICPHCRNFISFQDARRHPPVWIIVAAMLALIGAGWWVAWMLIGILTRP
jgi:hypothetical protein